MSDKNLQQLIAFLLAAQLALSIYQLIKAKKTVDQLKTAVGIQTTPEPTSWANIFA